MRAIDLQDNLSKAPLAAREQQIQQNSSEFGQRQVAQTQNQERILDQSRTKATEEADPASNRVDDQERQEQQNRHPKHKSPQTTPNKEEAAPPLRPSGDSSQLIDLIA